MNNLDLDWLKFAVERIPETRASGKIGRALLAAEVAHGNSGGFIRLSDSGWKLQLGHGVYDTLARAALDDSDHGAWGIAVSDPTGGPSTGPVLKHRTVRFPEPSFMGFAVQVSCDLPPYQWRLVKRRPVRSQPNGYEEHSYLVSTQGVIDQ